MQEFAYVDATREQLELNENIKLTLFGRVSCEPGWKGDRHQHPFWELVYIHKPNPDDYIIGWDNGEYREKDNTLYLMPPHVNHIFENTGKIEAQNLYIGFSFHCQQSPEEMESVPMVLPDDSVAVLRIKALLNEITEPLNSEELAQALNSRRMDVMRCIMELIHWMTEQNATISNRLIDRNAVLIDKIKEYILDHLDRYISVDELAKQLYLSPNYLGQVFRQSIGMTVKSYHNQMRMEKALHILLSGDLSIGEAADKLGFESVAYFSRKFKSFYGMSPSSLYLKKTRE